jgi:flavin-dependent dehydrogenase
MMKTSEVIIIGGGPAGASCAWQLKKRGVDFILLDKTEFPRFKPCAGWVTPQVLRDCELSPETYPGGITHFSNFQVSIKDLHFPLRTNQYAIRRYELDDWLLQRVSANYIHHEVRSILHENGQYVVDREYAAKYLVGAGGTHCPVSREIFKNSEASGKGSLIVAMEDEFAYNYSDPRCYLWFLQNGLPGYAWYVPKANGFVNIGVGGSELKLKRNRDSLKRHWLLLVDKLDSMGLVTNREYKPVGHSYFLRGRNTALRKGNAFLVGDAAGLATIDMGEGIGPAIQSGIRAAEAIQSGQEYSVSTISKYSFPSLLGLRKKG